MDIYDRVAIGAVGITVLGLVPATIYVALHAHHRSVVFVGVRSTVLQCILSVVWLVAQSASAVMVLH